MSDVGCQLDNETFDENLASYARYTLVFVAPGLPGRLVYIA